MKNKKLTYILFPLVILIWGLVIYRIFFQNRISSDNLQVHERVKTLQIEKVDKEQYDLVADYRDPFLSNITAPFEKNPENENKELEQVNLRRQRANISSVRWPEVSYGGFIKNDKENKFTLLFGVQKRNYLVHVGDTIQEIYIKAFYRDSILVVYNNEEKILKK